MLLKPKVKIKGTIKRYPEQDFKSSIRNENALKKTYSQSGEIYFSKSHLLKTRTLATRNPIRRSRKSPVDSPLNTGRL